MGHAQTRRLPDFMCVGVQTRAFFSLNNGLYLKALEHNYEQAETGRVLTLWNGQWSGFCLDTPWLAAGTADAEAESAVKGWRGAARMAGK